jgi:hypothetical protein
MAVFDLEERVEEAVKEVLKGSNLPSGVSLYMAQEKAQIEEPAIMIMLPSSDIPEQERGLEIVTGNRAGILTIGVRTHSDHGRQNHRDLVGAVRDLLYDSAIAGAINTEAAGVKIDRLEPQAAERTVTDGNSFLTAVQAEVWFRPYAAEDPGE